jgi:PAS domain S-box-containing protein
MGHIQILDAKRGVLEVVTHRGIGQEFLDLIREVSAADGSASGIALRSGERIVIADTESDARYIPFRPIARTAGYRAVQSTPIMSSQGRPLGMLSTYFRSAHQPNVEDLSLLDLYVRLAADIIERHQADNALRESEERLRLAQLKTGVGIWDWNLSSGQLAWTSQLTAIFGLEPDSVKGYADFRDRVHPEDIDAVEAQRDAAVRRRETFNLEFRIVRPDGQVRWVSAVGGAFYDEATGEPVRILGNNIDITERKRAEQTLAERNAQFDLARKAVRVGTYTYDNVARAMQLSSASAAILGLPLGTTEITGKDWRARVHPDDLRRLTTERRHAFQHGWPELVGEFRIIRPDGEVRWIEARARISYDDGGQPTRMIGVYIDVTERRQSDDHKTLLIAELDHRVKNVLACVVAVAQQSHECSRSAEEFLKMLNGRITSLSNTHALLSSSHWEGVALTELVCSELAFCTKDENAFIEGPAVDLAAEATQPVAMVLHELVTNAAKYGALSNGDGRVSVNWRRQPNGGSGGNLVLAWRETGGPLVVEPNAPGYGTSVIRDLIPYELGGSVDFVLAPEGARCMLEIPAKWLSDSSRRRGAASGANKSHTSAESLTR